MSPGANRIDLLGEYAEAVAALSHGDIEQFESLGVRPEVAGGLLMPYPVLGKARVAASDSGFYEPHPEGDMLYLCPCAWGTSLDDVEVLDLAAWRPSVPGRAWLRTGAGVVLNPEAPMAACLFDEPLFVFSDILSWLRGGCEGVTVLRWDASLPFHLDPAPSIQCPTREMAGRINKTYEMGRPEISYTEAMAA